MAETKSASRSGSKLNLNESTMPLLDEEAHEKAETPEKDAIELKEKASTTSEAEKDDSNPEKVEEGEEKKDEAEEKKSKKKEKKDKKEKEKKEKKEKCHRRTTSCVQTFTVGLNVLDRDEKHINDTINLNFEDVLAEPDAAHGFDPIWRTSYVLFTGSRYWIYRLLAAIFALPLALIWGITFSLITFISIWLATPILRVLDVFLFYIRRIWVALVQTTLEPVASAVGGCLANIKVSHANNGPLQTV